MVMDRMLVAQGEGFIRRYIELDVEAGKPGAEQALEWVAILEAGLAGHRAYIQDLENKLSNVKIALG